MLVYFMHELFPFKLKKEHTMQQYILQELKYLLLHKLKPYSGNVKESFLDLFNKWN